MKKKLQKTSELHHTGAIEPRVPKIVPFEELSRCGDEIWISHNGHLYRLRSTKLGKLILTK